MPFVQRDPSGKVVAVSQVPISGMVGIAADHPDYLAFFTEMGSVQLHMRATDLDFVRVLEDVIQILISRGVILFTDLPDSAQQKMINRQRLRISKQLAG